MTASTLPAGFREDPETGQLACPHRDIFCCASCADAHPEIIEVMGQHFWSPEFDEPEMCECEVDWTCGLHSGRAPWIDTRFQGQDADEARAFGVFEREFGDPF